MREIWKSFADLTVLKGLDLDIPPPQKLALIGPSGSGKSTIPRILMTLEGIDSGRVSLEDKNNE